MRNKTECFAFDFSAKMRVGIDAIGGIGDKAGIHPAFGKVRVVTPTTN
jgi:hypothetical protein